MRCDPLACRRGATPLDGVELVCLESLPIVWRRRVASVVEDRAQVGSSWTHCRGQAPRKVKRTAFHRYPSGVHPLPFVGQAPRCCEHIGGAVAQHACVVQRAAANLDEHHRRSDSFGFAPQDSAMRQTNCIVGVFGLAHVGDRLRLLVLPNRRKRRPRSDSAKDLHAPRGCPWVGGRSWSW